ncbi:MAG: gamma-glutamyl-gamma-aminobutyrate hydrolase family protein [Deltaproteobacteria bacterium]|nr:gamma-glutamyl-gamma-aminobutyrate hydrolase family protein [Deltaproteobacteria bacterium]
MSKVLVIQHVACEGLGIIEPELKKYGLKADFLKVFKNASLPRRIPQGYGALIVLGGPMGVYEDGVYPFIKDELNLLESALKTDLPILGVCLGSQMLAKAAGADVYKGKAKEIGWYKAELAGEGMKDRLFLGMPEEFTVFQWHGDTFDLPKGAVNLASSKLFKNQAIRVGRNAYGLQFHLEVTEKMIGEWIEVNAGELKSLKGFIDPDEILKETPKRIDALKRHGAAVISRFLRAVATGCEVCGQAHQR